MELQFLGTGGSQPIPLPTCGCELCEQANQQGSPYTRLGCEIHLPAIDGLIDASEFAPHNLTRWGVDDLEYLFLTHWHPDHAGGLRVLGMHDPPTRAGETFADAKRRNAPTVVTTRRVYERACQTVGVLEYLVEDAGFADVRFLDEEPIAVGEMTVEAIPYPLSANGELDAAAFLFRDGDATLAVVADDARYFDEGRLPATLDAAVFECGSFTHGPDGDRIAAEGVLPDDLRHEEVRAMVERVEPETAYLTHIGHQYRRTNDDFRAMERDAGPIRFASDGLQVEV